MNVNLFHLLVIISNSSCFVSESMSPGSRDNMDLHSKNPRIHFAVTKLEALNEPVNPTFRGKSHVIMSLLQDYRHGPSTANSLLVPIGFCVYKVITIF